jgi:hypothetical protein
MAIPRVHLFEFADYSWFPDVVRDLMTDYLHFVETKFRLHEPIPALLKQIVAETGTTDVVDLCSGGAGPIPAIDADLRDQGLELTFTLTDKYPNLGAFERSVAESGGTVGFVRESVDAADVPESLMGIRTIINGMHHFRPAEARAVLRNAVEANQPIATFELVERRAASIIPLFLIPVIVWVVTPAIRPRKLSRFLWTYLVPVMPLVTWWDGLVSHLRSYTPEELEALAEPFDGYRWRTGKAPIGKTGNNVTYLIGVPEAPQKA